jgi:hypothetical protein
MKTCDCHKEHTKEIGFDFDEDHFYQEMQCEGCGDEWIVTSEKTPLDYLEDIIMISTDEGLDKIMEIAYKIKKELKDD